MTDFSSSLRNRPLSTRMHESCGPIARYNSAATTDESTPPESPQITRSLPTRSRTCAIVCSAKSPSRQVPRAAADVGEEIGEDRFAVRRVRHFRVKLQAVERPLAMLHRGDRARRRAAPAARSRRRRASTWSPWLIQTSVSLRHAGEQIVRFAASIDRAMRPAELADRMALHAAAERLAHQLHAVADAEHRNAEIENRRVALRRAVGIHARRAAGKDEPFGASSRTRSAVISCRTISPYTCCSRTRRAMSWAYCEPKSSTSTRSAASCDLGVEVAHRRAVMVMGIVIAGRRDLVADVTA